MPLYSGPVERASDALLEPSMRTLRTGLSTIGRFLALADEGREGDLHPAEIAREIVVLGIVVIGSLLLLVLGGWRVAAYVAGWSDLASYHLAKYEYVAESLRAGVLPLWDPWEFGGIPFLASLQPGVFYPPVPILYSLWSGEAAHVVFFALHIAIGGIGSLVLMRSLGVAPWPSVLASLWVTQPLWLARIYDHPNFIATVCWIPWLILLLRRCLERPSTRAAVGLALVAGLQFLAGYPPATFATVYVLLLAAAFCLLERRGRNGSPGVPRIAGTLVLAGIVCALLVAAQLLPTAELAMLTDRQSEAAAAQQKLRALGESSASMFFLIGMPEPTFAAALQEFWRTYGPVQIGLALLGLALHRRAAVVWFFVLGTALCGLMPYPAYGKLPLYGSVRWALEWHLIAPIMTYAAAALGLDALVARGWLGARRSAAWVVVIAALCLGWNWRVVDAKWLVPQSTMAPPVPGWVAEACRLDDQRFRAFWPQGQVRAVLFAARVRSIGGYDQSLLEARTARLNQVLGIGNGAANPLWAKNTADSHDIVARMALRCLITPLAPILELGGFDKVATRAGLHVYTSPRALPRARLVRRARRVASAEEALAALRLVEDDEVLLEEPAPDLPGGACDGPPGDAVITVDGNEEVRIRTTAACASHLVLADTLMPGWSATIDGADAPIARADFAYRAVVVPAGEHEVVFRYAPWTVPVGLVASALGLLLAAALVVLPARYDVLRGAAGPATARGPDDASGGS